MTYEQVLDDPEAGARRRSCPGTTTSSGSATRSSSSAPTTRTSPGPTELAYNARIAANLGAPVVLVINGGHRKPARRRAGGRRRRHRDARPTTPRWSRSSPTGAPRARSAASATPCGPAPGCRSWAVPEDPLLTAPTVRQLSEAVRGHAHRGRRGPAVARGARRHRRRHVRGAPAAAADRRRGRHHAGRPLGRAARPAHGAPGRGLPVARRDHPQRRVPAGPP